jgi:hypothetical protein
MDDRWPKVQYQALTVCRDSWDVSHLDNLKKLHSGHVMSTREMAPLYVLDSEFRTPHIDGLHLHFAVLHRMMRQTLAPRIGDANAIPTFERNLLDVVMKNEHFDTFDYIVDEIWNIIINPFNLLGTHCSLHA